MDRALVNLYKMRGRLREITPAKNGEVTRLAASDGSGMLVVEMWCGSQVCKGAAGDRIYEQVARTARPIR